MKIALLPGHSSKDGGAVVCSGLYKGKSEFMLAGAYYLPALADRLREYGVDTVITTRDVAGGTTPTYSALAANATGADVALEFHFNAATPTARGSEVLYWGANKTGQVFAEKLSSRIAAILDVRDRGALAVPTPDNRGTMAFKKSRMPFFMIEPCFAGSNAEEAEIFCRMIDNGEWVDNVAAAINKSIREVYIES